MPGFPLPSDHRHTPFLFDQLHRAFVHLIKIIGCKIQMIFPVCPKPLMTSSFDRIYKLHLSFVGFVSSKRIWNVPLYFAPVRNSKRMDFACPICRYPFGPAESCADMIVHALCKVFVYFLFNKNSFETISFSMVSSSNRKISANNLISKLYTTVHNMLQYLCHCAWRKCFCMTHVGSYLKGVI